MDTPVGRKAPLATSSFKEKGVNVADFMGFEGFDDSFRVLKELEFSGNFDAVLVSAGIPAVFLCPEIAKKFSTVALDVGHVMDILANNNFSLRAVRGEWFKSQPKFQGKVLGSYVVLSKETGEHFLLGQGLKYRIPSRNILKVCGLHPVKTVPEDFLAQVPSGGVLRYPDGHVKSSQPVEDRKPRVMLPGKSTQAISGVVTLYRNGPQNFHGPVRNPSDN